MTTKWHWLELNETLVGYGIDQTTQQVGWTLVPKTLADQIATRSQPVDSLVQIALRGDAAAKGFLNGMSMHNSQTATQLRYVDQQVQDAAERRQVITTLSGPCGLVIQHIVTGITGQQALTVAVRVVNHGAKSVVIEHLDSFCLSRLSPLQDHNQPGDLLMTRYASKWAQEARLQTAPIEALGLEPSWKPSGASTVRFGQIGSMPVRGFFPYVGVFDRRHQVAWAVQLSTPTSWQIEAFRKQDDLVLCGGLADAEYGHWHYLLKPGAAFVTPEARVAVGVGSVAQVSQALPRLTQLKLQARHLEDAESLPIIYNEFCASWGHPTQAALTKVLPLLAAHGVRYVVIDAGWYANAAGAWEANVGDWQVNATQFPDGLQALCQQIRAAGLVPGLWFEPETVGKDADANLQVAHLLHKNGQVIQAGTRRFWDMTDPWVQAYLHKQVLGLLQRCGFGYLKVDYNDNIGVGCDGADSLGEGLRQQGLAAQAFVDRLREAMPELVIETCASGGHRLEASWLDRSDMASFSDAHEAVCLPLIAGQLHALMLPQQAQIWAVLRAKDDTQRLSYSLAATFLGRMCLSGDVAALTPAQWAVVDAAITFYQHLPALLKNGISTRYGQAPLSYQQPTGAQVIRRATKTQQVLVYHRFGGQDTPLSVAIDHQHWQVKATFGSSASVSQTATGFCFAALPWTACALYLEASDAQD